MMKINISTRIIGNTPLASIFEYSAFDYTSHTYGKLIFLNLIRVIPQFVFPNKAKIDNADQLLLNMKVTPLFTRDIDDSLYLYSYIILVS